MNKLILCLAMLAPSACLADQNVEQQIAEIKQVEAERLRHDLSREREERRRRALEIRRKINARRIHRYWTGRQVIVRPRWQPMPVIRSRYVRPLFR